jgi:hypothetical protein
VAQRHPARALLSPIFEHFMEGWDTADVMAGKHLLTTLIPRLPPPAPAIRSDYETVH